MNTQLKAPNAPRCQYSELSDNGKILLSTLRRFTDRSGLGFPSFQKLKSICWPTVTERHARRKFASAMAELEKCGLVTREARWRANGSQSSNLYRLAPSARYAPRSKPVARKPRMSPPLTRIPDPVFDQSSFPDRFSNSAPRDFRAEQAPARKPVRKPPGRPWRTWGSHDVGPVTERGSDSPKTATGRVWWAYAQALPDGVSDHSSWAQEKTRVLLARFVGYAGEERATAAVRTFARSTDPWLVERGHPLALLFARRDFALAPGGAFSPARWNFRAQLNWHRTQRIFPARNTRGIQ